VYLGVLAILSTLDTADLRIHPGTRTRNPINCGTQVGLVAIIAGARRAHHTPHKDKWFNALWLEVAKAGWVSPPSVERSS
jgi:hypothetical protein